MFRKQERKRYGEEFNQHFCRMPITLQVFESEKKNQNAFSFKI